ncbi:MAG: YqgE/AlgH family protein [Chloroflexi bacterium]|nr:YqgE/AlgH family protein [Chloroflexota bacterium]
MRHAGPDLAPGTLLIAPPAQDADLVFARAVVVIVDREPNGITTAIAINRPLAERVIDSSALALLFVPEPDAPAFWGGPMGTDPAILAQFSAVDGLEWFHLPIEQRRPFVLPDVGVIAVAEHPGPIDGRIRRSRLFIGLCVWACGQLEAEVERGNWLLGVPTADDLFSAEPERLWAALVARTPRTTT